MIYSGAYDDENAISSPFVGLKAWSKGLAVIERRDVNQGIMNGRSRDQRCNGEIRLAVIGTSLT